MKATLELSGKKNRNGLFEIYVRIQEGTKKKRVKAGIAVEKFQFKSKHHNLKWIRKHPNHVKLNSDLKLQLEKYECGISTSYIQRTAITPELLIHKINIKADSEKIVDYTRAKMLLMDNYNNKKAFSTMVNHWIAFTEEAKLGELTFRNVSVDILQMFENYLRSTGMAESTNYTTIKNLRIIFNKAKKQRMITHDEYPFANGYSLPKVGKTKKEKLTLSELKRFISDTYYPDGSVGQNTKMGFLLSFNLGGVRVEDLLIYKWSQIKNNRFEYRMTKTSSLDSTLITGQLQEIIEYFKKYSKGYYVLPFLDEGIEDQTSEIYKKEIGRQTTLMNKYLKIIGKDAKIDKNITNHIARHTFGSIAKASGADIFFIQQKLKHKNAGITENYLAELDIESMDKQMEKVTKITKGRL